MKKAGRLFLLKVWLDGAYTTIAAQRTTSMNLGNEQIDVTSKDGSRWRELLEGGTRNVSISSSGLVNDSDSHALMLQYAHEGTIGEYQLLFADDLALELTMQISQFESTGDYKDAQQYSITFDSANDAELVLPSAGTIQWTASGSSVTAGSNATLTASRAGGTDNAVSVSYATANGTAIAGVDYTATSGTLSWADGDSANKTVNVPTAAPSQDQLIFFDPAKIGPGVALSGGDRVATYSFTSSWESAVTLISRASGCWVFEQKKFSVGGNPYFGIGPGSISLTSGSPTFNAAGAFAYTMGGEVYQGFGGSSSAILSGLPTYGTGDLIAFLIDFDAGNVWLSKNGVVMAGDPQAGTGAMFTFPPSTEKYPVTMFGQGNPSAVEYPQTLAYDYGRFSPWGFVAKTFTVTLSSPTGGATLGSPIVQVVTIGTVLSYVQFSAQEYFLPYPGGDFPVVLQRFGPRTDALSLSMQDDRLATYTAEWEDGDTTDKTVQVTFHWTDEWVYDIEMPITLLVITDISGGADIVGEIGGCLLEIEPEE